MSAQPILERLRRHDTPTIWTALTRLRGPGIAGFTRHPFVSVHPDAPPVVGYALTARLVSDSPSRLAKEAQKAIRHAYYRYLEGGPRPSVVVIEDGSVEAGLGSFWGELNSAIHRGLGVSGVVTNGAVRDLDHLDRALPILAGGICLGTGFAHLTEIDVPVTVLGMQVRPGDLLHADRHGAMVIPAAHLDEMPAALDALQARERAVLAETRKPGFDAEAMIRAWEIMDARY